MTRCIAQCDFVHENLTEKYIVSRDSYKIAVIPSSPATFIPESFLTSPKREKKRKKKKKTVKKYQIERLIQRKFHPREHNNNSRDDKRVVFLNLK